MYLVISCLALVIADFIWQNMNESLFENLCSSTLGCKYAAIQYVEIVMDP